MFVSMMQLIPQNSHNIFGFNLLFAAVAYYISLNKVNGSNIFPLRVNLIFGNNQMLFKVHSSEHAFEVCETSFSQEQAGKINCKADL